MLFDVHCNIMFVSGFIFRLKCLTINLLYCIFMLQVSWYCKCFHANKLFSTSLECWNLLFLAKFLFFLYFELCTKFMLYVTLSYCNVCNAMKVKPSQK